MSHKDEDSETRLAIHKIHAITGMVTRIFSEAFKWGSLGFIGWCAADAFTAYAGEASFADISFSFLVSEKIESVLATIFGVGGIIYGKWQSKLRRDVIEKMQPERIALEKQADPDRTSSGLTKRGDTRGGDE